MTHRALVVDDDPLVARALGRTLRKAGLDPTLVTDPEEAIRIAAETSFDLVTVDLCMPRLHGCDVIRHVRRCQPTTTIAAISGTADPSESAQAVIAGANRFFSKPFHFEDLVGFAKKAVAEASRASLDENGRFERFGVRFVGEDSTIGELFRVIERVARADVPVLVSGESGTGKELISRAIHNGSARRAGMLVPVNCGAIPPTLIESELFGHVRGAFTGATNTREGRFTVADKGTIFLDEIGEMSAELQVRLLRVLQDGNIHPVGAARPHNVDVRVIAATHQNLDELIEQGKFREDLYYRLAVVTVHIPPLRERRADILLLARHFLADACARRGLELDGFTAEAEKTLERYDWPGNVRQLRNAVERAVVLRDSGEIDVEGLPARICGGAGEPAASVRKGTDLPASGVNLRSELERLEKELIEAALERTSGNKNRAAQLLGLNRTTLVEKLRRRRSAA